ncbi:MAG: hypothetical protein ACRDKE_03785 [Solirubrobacterales bacterium]
MRINPTRAGVSVLIAALAALTFTAVASAALTAPACKAHSKMKKACFPKKIAGSFSGENDCYSWKGTLKTKRHKEQTTYQYEGDGSFDWVYKPSCNPGCTPSITSGKVAIEPGIVINRTRNKGQGWFYTGDDMKSQVLLGMFTWDCGSGPGEPANEALVAAFNAGGQSKRLKIFKGAEKMGTVYKWSLTGSN